MRILLDECVPRGMRRELRAHEVATVPELGWSGKKNGELMRLTEAQGFDVFLTVDQNVQYQQHLQGTSFAVIVLSAVSNRLADLLPLAAAMRAALSKIQPGAVIEIKA